MTVRVFGPGYMPKGFKANLTSKSVDEFRLLSPFFLEPVGGDAKNIENLWQYSKVYPSHVDENNEPLPTYFQWRSYGYAKSYGDRYPMGKGAKPLYSLWQGQKLGYIEARMRIYEPQYRAAVLLHGQAEISLLKEKLREHKEIWLFDFDGYDHIAYGMSLAEVGRNPDRPMGHAFVVASILTGEAIF